MGKEGVSVRRELWRHRESGDVYVVEFADYEGEGVIAVAGPIRPSMFEKVLQDGFISDPYLLDDILDDISGKKLELYLP